MFNLGDFAEFEFTEPTWGRLRRVSPRSDHDEVPGAWHIMGDILALKGTALDELGDANVTH